MLPPEQWLRGNALSSSSECLASGTNGYASATRHLQCHIAAILLVTKFAVTYCGDAATIDPVANLDFFVAPAGQSYERPSIGGLTVDPDQVDAPQVYGISHSCLLCDRCLRGNARCHCSCCGDLLYFLLFLLCA